MPDTIHTVYPHTVALYSRVRALIEDVAQVFAPPLPTTMHRRKAERHYEMAGQTRGHLSFRVIVF